MDFQDGKVDINGVIPYLNDRFQTLLQILKTQISLSIVETPFQEQVAIRTVLEGIQYKLEVIKALSDEGQIRLVCEKLVGDLNIAIYSIFSDKSGWINSNNSGNTNENVQWLNAYREYLQSLYNSFRNDSGSKQKNGYIYTLALDLLQAETKMNVLFSEEYLSTVPYTSKNNVIGAVSIPSDSNVDNIYMYLPKLTHEVSHGFKYSDTSDRNKFVLGYLLDLLCRKIVRELFFQVSGDYYDMFIGDCEYKMADAIKQLLWDTITDGYPDFLEYGHLDTMPSVILSIFFTKVDKSLDLQGLFKEDVSSYDILKQSFINLTKISSMNWYMSESVSSMDYTDFQKILSIVADIFVYEDMKQVAEKYQDVSFTNDVYSTLVNDYFHRTEEQPYLTKSMLEIARDELMIDIVEKYKKEFMDRKDIKMNSGTIDDILLALVKDRDSFTNFFYASIGNIHADDQYVLRQFIDEILYIRANLEKIYYLLELQEGMVKRNKSNEEELSKKIYACLRTTILNELNSKTSIMFSTRYIHENLIKLGLLNSEEDSEQFEKIFVEIFNHWDKKIMKEFLEQTLNVYREIFADLSMCAIFNMNPKGYFRYITQQFRYTRSLVQGIFKNEALQRISIVMRALAENGSDWNRISAADEKEIFWNPVWDDIFWKFEKWSSSSDKNGTPYIDYEQRYASVFRDNIKNKKWVKRFAEYDVVKKIGEYYNNTSMDVILKYEFDSTLNEEFKETFLKIADNRVMLQKERTDADSMVLMMEDLMI